MEEDRLNEIIQNIQNKLGDDAGLIADDIGELISQNNNVIENIENNENELNLLKKKNEDLTKVNGNLLKQVTMKVEEPEKENNSSNEHISFKDIFDEKGNFIK